MAKIDASNVTLNVRVPGTKPTVTPKSRSPVGFDFNSPTIDADASMRLTGTAGENVADWTLGFIQLKYIGTNHARYRGATDREGSALITHSNKIVCRDTDIGSHEVWYDSLNAGRTIGPTGTNKLTAGTNKLAMGTVLPPAKYLDVRAHLSDHPSRSWSSVHINTLVAGQPKNFLHYAVVELLFCTMLVAQDPAGSFHMLKHFYWNVIWEHTFKLNSAGGSVVDRATRLQQNVQTPARSGNPHDSKFLGKEFNLALPVSNTILRQAPVILQAVNWGQS